VARGDPFEVADGGAPAWVGCASSRGTVAVTAVSVIMISITLAEYFIPGNVLRLRREKRFLIMRRAQFTLTTTPRILGALNQLLQNNTD
jgi:hypothetical protein